MEALISGTAGLAAFIDGDVASLINCRGDTIHSSRYADVVRQFGIYEDTIILSSASEQQALQLLKQESQKSDALLLTLSILDSDVKLVHKKSLSFSLNELVKEDSILQYIRGILFSRPLPSNAIKEVPDELAESPVVKILISELLDAQNSIVTIYTTWLETAQKFRLDQDDINYIEGVFSSNLVGYQLSRSTISNADLNNLKFNCVLKLEGINNSRQIINGLFSSYKGDVVVSKKQHQHPSIRIQQSDVKKPPQQDSHALFELTKSQRAKIDQLLDDGDINQAKKITNELIASQLLREDHEFAAKSLCQLSESAKNIGDFTLQLEWSRRAAEVYPEDARSYGHVADAYLNLSQLENARVWFEKSIEAGAISYGKAGIARIERFLFNYERALYLIEEAIEQGDADYETYTLNAEILRDLQRTDDAANLYQQISKDYPQYSMPLCGLAAVRTDQRAYEDAEHIYRRCIELYPVDQVPYTGLGFLLARLGRFTEGFKFLDKGIALSEKRDFIPKMAKANALRMKGRYEKAEALYRDLIQSLSNVIDPWVELIDLLLTSNRQDEALIELNKAKSIFGDNEYIQRCEGLLYKYESNFVESLAIFDSLKSSHPRWIPALLDRAGVLKQLGQYDESRKQYVEILSIRQFVRRAQTGIDIIDTLTKSRPSTITEDSDLDPVTVDDWEQINIKALLKLSHNKSQEAKRLFLYGFKKSPFGSSKKQFSLGLSVARTKLGQYGTAIKTIKNVDDNIGLIQKAIVYGEQGKFDDVERNLSKITQDRSNTSNVISLIAKRYAGDNRNKQDAPTVSQLIDEQVKAMLIAA